MITHRRRPGQDLRQGSRRRADFLGAATVRWVTAGQDQWAQWVLRRRDADDAGVREYGAVMLARYRDGVLDRGAIAGGDVLLDVGTGDGLIGFAALDRVGAAGAGDLQRRLR
jgi:hypothetical protein